MDPHVPFLRAIAANPADDLPRLVYADFLEETGDAIHAARGHFIRAQIALETLRPRTREFRRAKAMEERLREMFLHNWLYDLPEYLRDGRVTWRRGFPHSVRMRVGHLLEIGRMVFVAHPLVGLHLDDGLGRHRLGRVDFLTRLTHLKLGPHFYPILPPPDANETLFFTDLMTLPVLPALRSLDLSENQLTDAWLVRFASRFPNSSFALTLAELNLSRCYEITDAGANTLATARGLDRLTVLNLTGVPLNPPAVAMLRIRFGAGLRV